MPSGPAARSIETGEGDVPTRRSNVRSFCGPPSNRTSSGMSATPTRTRSASASPRRRSHRRASGRVAMSRMRTGSSARYQESRRCDRTRSAIRERAVSISSTHSTSVRSPLRRAMRLLAKNEPTTMMGEAAAMRSMIGRWNTMASVTPSTIGTIAESQGSGEASASAGLSPGSWTTGVAEGVRMREGRLNARAPTSSTVMSASDAGASPIRRTLLPTCTRSAGTICTGPSAGCPLTSTGAEASAGTTCAVRGWNEPSAAGPPTAVMVTCRGAR